ELHLSPEDRRGIPDPQRPLLQVGERIGAVAQEHDVVAEVADDESDEAVLLEVLVDARLEVIEEEQRLVAALHDAGDAGHAERRGQAAAEERAGRAVELAALDARDRGRLVAGDAAEVPLHVHVAVRGVLDVAGHGLELARPAGALGGDGGHAQHDRLVAGVGERRGQQERQGEKRDGTAHGPMILRIYEDIEAMNSPLVSVFPTLSRRNSIASMTLSGW